MTNTFTTENPDGTPVTVTYTYHRGYPASWDEPGEPDAVEIERVVPDVADWSNLVDECFEDYANYQADVAEWKADMRSGER